jgi:2'-5' RNA ligase
MTVPRASSRLFLAVWPDGDTVARIMAWRDRQSWPAGVRLTSPESMHATLHFIGEVPHARVGPIAERLETVAFEGGRLAAAHPTVWAGGIAVLQAEVDQPLVDLHARLADVLRALQLPLDPRPWHPHLTLARHAQGASMLGLRPAPECAVDAFTLVESISGRYDVLKRFPAHA